MCNACVQPVQTLSKSHGLEHNIYAQAPGTNSRHGHNHRLSATSTHRFTHGLSTQNNDNFNPLDRTLSTLCTGPITKDN
jgi:hypothetical protein